MLLVRFGGLGDLLVTLPSIRYLRAKFQEAHLTLISRKRYGELFLEAEVVDEIIPEDSPRILPLFDEDASLTLDFAGWLRSFELIICWTQGNAGDFLSKAPGFHAGGLRPRIIRADPQKSEPLSRIFFRKTAAIFGETRSLRAEEWSRLPLQGAPDGPGPKIIIHPGSGGEAKRWPLRNFLRVVDELAEKEIAGALVTGEAEEHMASKIANFNFPLNWMWIRCPSILALAGLLNAAELYLGNDSGVTHLAAACGAEVVAIFRNEYASAWRPLGQVHLMSAASLDEIRPESVLKILFSRLKK